MATRQGDELSGDPGPAGTSPAAVGPPADRAPAAEGVMPSAAEWEQTWLPGWLTGPEADTEDGIGGAGIPPEPFVLPAGGADPVAAVPDRFSGEGAPEGGGPGCAITEEAAVAGDGAAGVDGPDLAVADPRDVVAVETVRPRVVVRPRVRPRRRAATAVAVGLLTVGGIAGAALLTGSSTGAVPIAAVQVSPGAVAPPTRAIPATPPSGLVDAVAAASTTSAPMLNTPVQEASPDPAPVPVRAARPPATSPATVPDPDASLSVVVPPVPPASPVPAEKPVPTPTPTSAPASTSTPTSTPASTSAPTSAPASTSDPAPASDPAPTSDPTDGDGTGTQTPEPPEPTAPDPEDQAQERATSPAAEPTHQ